jgi:gliding motility-associated-like protein
MSFEWTFAKLGETPGVRKSYEINPINIEFDADTGEIPVYLRAVTEYGCWDTTSRKIYVEPDITVFIPNAFRPGSDVDCPEGDLDCNKAFKVAADGYATIDIIVFNRWGQQVFRTNNHNIGWKGTVNNVNGQECPQDVYIYQIYATSFNGKQYKYSGSVTLLR